MLADQFQHVQTEIYSLPTGQSHHAFMQSVDDWLGTNPTPDDIEAARIVKAYFWSRKSELLLNGLAILSIPPLPDSVEKLGVNACNNITTLSAKHLQKIAALSVNLCAKLTGFSGEFPQLKTLIVSACESIVSLSGNHFPQLTSLNVHRNTHLNACIGNFRQVETLNCSFNHEITTFSSFPLLKSILLIDAPNVSDWSILFNAQRKFIAPADYGIRFLKTASDKGNPAASLKLAGLYFEGKLVEKNVDEAKKYLHRAIKGSKDNPTVSLNLARIYSDGEFIEKNTERSKQYLRQAIVVTQSSGFYSQEQKENVIKKAALLSIGKQAAVHLADFGHFPHHLSERI